jgi:hypothetical protein
MEDIDRLSGKPEIIIDRLIGVCGETHQDFPFVPCIFQILTILFQQFDCILPWVWGELLMGGGMGVFRDKTIFAPIITPSV